MTDFDWILGLPVALAKQMLAQKGISPVDVLVTAPPRQPDQPGMLRVVAVRGGGHILLAAAFSDPITQAEPVDALAQV